MNWNGAAQGVGGWIGNPVTNNPSTNPYPYHSQPVALPNHYPAPGSPGFGMDPHPMFTAAINRLAAAIEALAAKPEGK